MNFSYKNTNEEYEQRLIHLIYRIKENPCALLGELSLEKLNFFLSGYEYAFLEFTGYRLHFDADFQKYVETVFDIKEAIHWNKIIDAKEKSNESAFELFFSLLNDFCEARGRLLRTLDGPCLDKGYQSGDG